VPRTEGVSPTVAEDPFARPAMTVQGNLEDGTPIGVTADGHYFKGNPDAPVVFFEFSDYQ
jgi:protein-disulfide isomerase